MVRIQFGSRAETRLGGTRPGTVPGHGRTPPVRTAVSSASRLDLPVAAAEHRNSLPGCRDAVDFELGRADHEVDVRRARVHPLDVVTLDEERKAAAEGDVARGVLVEQRVVEDSA